MGNPAVLPPDEDTLIWVDFLMQNSRPMLEMLKQYLTIQALTAQAEMDTAVDSSNLVRAARAKGKRDAMDGILHDVVAREA